MYRAKPLSVCVSPGIFGTDDPEETVNVVSSSHVLTKITKTFDRSTELVRFAGAVRCDVIRCDTSGMRRGWINCF